MNTQSYGHLIFDKGAKTIQWKKDSIFNKWCWLNWRLVTKELKGSATLYVEQQYELTVTPRACVARCICIRRWPSRPSVDRGPLVMQTLYASVRENARAKKWEWVVGGVDGGACGGLLG